MWRRIFGVFFSAAWRIGLATLLLIIPGIYLALRYALALSVAAFEDRSGVSALEASAANMKGRYWRVALGVSAAALIYAPMAFAPLMAAPGGASPWLLALLGAPFNVLASFITIGLTLVYADYRRGEVLVSPVARPDHRSGMNQEWNLTTGRWGVFCAAVISAAALIGALSLWNWLAIAPINAGDEAWEREAYAEALEYYRRAAYWDPEDAYVQYSLGWVLYSLDQTAEAETHFARSVELAPEEGQYRVDHARTLIDLGQTQRAGAELAAAREKGFSDAETLADLEANLKRTAAA